MARIHALVERWGVAAVLGVATVLLLAGLGATGLWEPWEMDRADLSRAIADPPQAFAAIGDDAALQRGLEEAAARAGVALRIAARDTVEAGRQESAAVQATLDEARTQIVAAIVLDVPLILPDADQPGAWKAAAAKVNAALDYVPNGRVLLLEHTAVTREELRSRLAVARVRETWEALAAKLGSLPFGQGPDASRQLDQAIQRVAASLPPEPRLVFVPPGDVDAMAAALADAAGGHAAIVAFKDRGETVTLPPLEAWLRTAAFRALGPSEFSVRLPSAILALLALWVLMLTLRTVWGGRVAAMAGLVLLTTPLYYAQARSAAGEPAAILALTLVACGLLLRERQTAVRVVWAYLIAGFVVGFLAKGLFASLLFTALAAAGPLIAASTKPSRWLPAVAFGALTALLALWVLNAPADGFAGQFRFTLPLFSDGPSVHARNFDLMAREIGFGLFPWSPFAVVALGATAFHAVRHRDQATLTVALWFILPTVFLMAALKDFNQLVWPAVPASAVAIALLFEQLITRGAKSFFVAISLFFMVLLIVRETGAAPDGLVAFLTMDPPFADKGDLRFPETLALATWMKALVLLVGLLAVAYFGRLVTFARDALVFFRRERPFAIAVGATLILAPLYWLVRVGEAHRVASNQANLATLGEGQRAFIKSFASFAEPVFLVGMLTAIALVLAVTLRWVFPSAGRLIGRLVGGVMARALTQRVLFGLAAATWLVLAVILALSVTFPEDYWGDALFGGPSLAAYAGALALGALAWRGSGRDPVQVVAVVVGALALLVATRLIRDAGWRDGWVVALVALGWLFAAPAVLAQLLVRPERFAIGAGALIALCLLAVDVPLFDRYAWVEQVLYPGQDGYLTGRLVLRSTGTWVVYLGLVGLVINRRFHDQLAPLGRHTLRLERGPLVVAATLAVALLVTVGTAFGFHARLADNVSQKHVIDSWRAAVGADADAPLRLFKHGAFAAQGRKDANFYTAGLPEIRDRQTALEVLFGARDAVATIDTGGGSAPVILPGWSVVNDSDRDGRRDRQVVRGFATAVGDETLTDATQRWTPGALIGRKLVDADGRTWDITANDATTVTCTGRGRLTFNMAAPIRRFYAVDVADAADHRATADTRERRGMLLPAESLSELNFAYRRLSGGRHIPVLDGTSYRVLLATGWLEPGEEQQNRIANATYTQSEFEALPDRRIKRVWGVFEDEIQVVGYKLHEAVATKGDKYRLTVYFKALKAIRKSYKIFMHMDLQGATERIHGDHWPINTIRETEDNKNCVGCFRTDHWLPGDIVADTYDIEIGTVASGDYMIWLGFYLPGPDTRMTLKNWDKKVAQHDGQNRLGIGTFLVR